MLGLPKSTEFNRRIPKQKFYEKLSVTPALKRIFIEQIDVIYWRNKISSSTMNLASGKVVTEIEVFEIRLVDQKLDVSVLKQIDEEVPYHIIFLLKYDGKYQVWTAFKETVLMRNNAFKVGKYYHTNWLIEQDIPLKIEGIDIDVVYENFVRQIAGEILRENNVESLKASVERDIQKEELQKQIKILQSKIRKENQLNKQVQLNTKLKKLRKELEIFL